MNDLLRKSKEIYDVAVATYKPKAIVLMLSGGDDSMVTYYVARELGIKFDLVIHGNTRTGIEDTTLFTRKVVSEFGDKYVEADAGDNYIKYVMRKGFFGKGDHAHNYSFHVLKAQPFRTAVSHNLRQRKRNFPVLFINGARRQESDRREITMINPYKCDPAQKNNIWVNLINDWSNHETTDYIESEGRKRNPVSKLLCRSGECMCGTMQSKGDRFEAGFWFPKWKKWIDELDKQIIEIHGWGWDDDGPPKKKEPKFETLDMFQPMCTGCKVNYNEIINP